MKSQFEATRVQIDRAAESEDPAHEIGKFSNVPRPSVGHEAFKKFGVKARRRQAHLGGAFLRKMVRKNWNVFATLAQRRQ
jgi:hypothetical protein